MRCPIPALCLTMLALCACSGTPEQRTPSVTRSISTNLALPEADLRGAPLDLEAELGAGRPVVLVFWQTWCASCRREAPEMAAAARTFEGRFRFVGVVPGGTDYVDPEELLRTAEEWGLPYAQVQDTDLTLTHALDVRGTPTIVVLGRGKEILYRGHKAPESWEALLD